MRFANHSYDAMDDGTRKVQSLASKYRTMANCRPIIVFNGYENTPYLLAKRDIEAGEELVWDYNYQKPFDWLNEYNIKYMINDTIF